MPSTIPSLIIVNLLAEFLPKVGVNLGGDAITTFVQVLIGIVSGVWIYFHHKNVVAGKSAL